MLERDKLMSLYKKGQELINHGIKVFLVDANKFGINPQLPNCTGKGSASATLDKQVWWDWFANDGLRKNIAGIGVVLTGTQYVAVDIDAHFELTEEQKESIVSIIDERVNIHGKQRQALIIEEQHGYLEELRKGYIRSKLIKMHKQGYSVGNDEVYFEVTKRHGLHFFLKINDTQENIDALRTHIEFKASDGVLEHVELRRNDIIIAPSEGYGIPHLASVKDIWETKAIAPQWIIDKLSDNPYQPSPLASNNGAPFIRGARDKKYTGVLLDRIVEGASDGNRHNWFKALIGSLFNSDAKPTNILTLLGVINDNFVNPPLDNVELKKIFDYVLKKENRKRGIK